MANITSTYLVVRILVQPYDAALPRRMVMAPQSPAYEAATEADARKWIGDQKPGMDERWQIVEAFKVTA